MSSACGSSRLASGRRNCRYGSFLSLACRVSVLSRSGSRWTGKWRYCSGSRLASWYLSRRTVGRPKKRSSYTWTTSGTHYHLIAGRCNRCHGHRARRRRCPYSIVLWRRR